EKALIIVDKGLNKYNLVLVVLNNTNIIPRFYAEKTFCFKESLN
ncbi:hypothetical protein V045_02756, partial [Staphylococcus aureus S62_POEL]